MTVRGPVKKPPMDYISRRGSSPVIAPSAPPFLLLPDTPDPTAGGGPDDPCGLALCGAQPLSLCSEVASLPDSHVAIPLQATDAPTPAAAPPPAALSPGRPLEGPDSVADPPELDGDAFPATEPEAMGPAWEPEPQVEVCARVRPNGGAHPRAHRPEVGAGTRRHDGRMHNGGALVPSPPPSGGPADVFRDEECGQAIA